MKSDIISQKSPIMPEVVSVDVNYIQKIPSELISEILSFLGKRALCTIAQVCKSFKNLSEEDDIWKKLVSPLGRQYILLNIIVG